MVILESTVYFDNIKLIERLYPAGKSGEFLNKFMRDSLVQGIGLLVLNQFKDEVYSAKMGKYHISMVSREIPFPGNPDIKKPIFMYSIADSDTNINKLLRTMTKALDLFLNRFSRNDIYAKDSKAFLEFADRFDKIFEEFIFTMKDRLKQIF